jgi:hypothetical protein
LGYGKAAGSYASTAVQETDMARKAVATKRGDGAKTKAAGNRSRSKSSGPSKRSKSQPNAGDAFIALLQSPLVADLVAVAATAALAALAEEGFGRSSSSDGSKRAGKAVKRAGKAAAEAVGRRLSSEMEEIRKAAKSAKAGAK